jgi:putative transposase
MSRGNGKMPIFLDDRDYSYFVALLSKVVVSYSIRCWNYCLMPNHYHATLQPALPNLSEAVRDLNGVYGNWWNWRHGRVGHVFQGRYKAQIVDREEYLVTLSRYVVLNPVRAGLAKRPEDWPWSSYRATAGLSSAPLFLDTAATLGLFSPKSDEQAARFAEAMASSRADETTIDRIRSNARILGSAAFRDRVKKGQTQGSDSRV